MLGEGLQLGYEESNNTDEKSNDIDIKYGAGGRDVQRLR